MAISILLFMVCLNLATYILSASEIYPGKYGAYSPTQLIANLTIPDLIIAGGITAGGVLISLVTHTFVGPAILIVWGLGYLTSLGKWLLVGFPEMLDYLGLPSYLSLAGKVIMAFAICTLVLEITTQRELT